MFENNFEFDSEQLRQRYNPEGSKLRHDQLELLQMLKRVDAICKENNIQWWLSTETLFGAARHGGFIPWNDDIDIVMTRKEVKRLEKTSLLASRAAKIIYRNLQHLSIYVKTKLLRHLTTRIIQILCLGIIVPIIRLIGKINPKGEYHYTLGIGWQKSTFFAKDIFPLSTAMFEGHEFPVPKDMDAYLRGAYGDWRKIPTEEQIKASIHCVEYR